MRRLVILILALVLNSSALAVTQEESYKLRKYDKIDVILTDQDDSETSYTGVQVLPTGTVVLPKVGEIEVANLDQEQVRAEILKHSNYADVQLLLHHSIKNISVLGAVNKPGNYPVEKITTIYDAIAVAGGFSAIAKKSKVKHIRQRKDGSREQRYINFPKEVFNITEPGNGVGEEHYLLVENDIIYVPESAIKKTGKFFASILKAAIQVTTLGLVTGAISAAIN